MKRIVFTAIACTLAASASLAAPSPKEQVAEMRLLAEKVSGTIMNVSLEAKSFVVGPDGKVISQDSGSAGGSTRELVSKALEKAVEAVKKAGASEEVVKSVEKALQDAIKRSENKTAAEPKAN